MKRIFSIAIAVLLGTLTSFAEQIKVTDIALVAGGTTTVEIEMDNENANLVAFQMDLTLPEGISIDKAGCTLSSRITDEEQVLTIGRLSANSYRLTSTSFLLVPISGTSGALLTLKLTSTTDFVNGQATLTNILFSTASSQEVAASDVSFTINTLYTLTYMVDGEVYKTSSVAYGTTLIPEATPTKEGHTFSGWSEIPETMPANNVTVIGSFTVNDYTLTYMLDGEVYKTVSIAYGTAITPEAEPEKEGYTFSGWSEMPETMPAMDVVVTGSFSINSYTLTYIVDGEVYNTYTVVYGTAITPEEEPTKEGYTFSGWSDIPATMPAKDVTVSGTFSVNSYTLTYMVDDETYKTSSVPYGSKITPEAEPNKEGYTFSGWGEIPETMPAKDVTVTGTFSINSYTLTYIVDGEVYKTLTIVYGIAITPEAEPEKEGYTFSGWSEIPETMPASDVTVTGMFVVNSYTLTYMVDGEEYQSFTINYRDPITPLEAPTKEGYTFSGWDGLPRSMPAKDVVVKGSFTINKYILTYMVDGVEYKSYEINYAAAIIPEAEPTKEGYTFSGWSEIPKTMPANDVVITGTFTVNSYTVRFMYRDEVLYTEEVNYGESIPLPELYDDYGLLIKWLDVPETMPAHDIVILVDETDAVLNIQGEKGDNKVYDLNGHRLATHKKGINIIRKKDGTTRKVLIK